MGGGLGGDPGDEGLDLGQPSFGLGVDQIIGKIHGSGDLQGRDQPPGIQVILGDGALGQGHATAIDGGLDDKAGLVEPGSPGPVDASQRPIELAGGLQTRSVGFHENLYLYEKIAYGRLSHAASGLQPFQQLDVLTRHGYITWVLRSTLR